MLTPEDARPWYSSDPVHGYDHVLRVYHLAERLAQVEGADLEIVRAAALLHDAAGSDAPSENRSACNPRYFHEHASADFAAQVLAAHGWSAERIAAVQHCIRAHRFRSGGEQPQTLEARVLFDADKLDAIGAVGVARAIAYAVQAGQPFYAKPSEMFTTTGRLEPGEPHSAYHEYIFKLSKLKSRLSTATAHHLAQGRVRLMEAFFSQLAQEYQEES